MEVRMTWFLLSKEEEIRVWCYFVSHVNKKLTLLIIKDQFHIFPNIFPNHRILIR